MHPTFIEYAVDTHQADLRREFQRSLRNSGRGRRSARRTGSDARHTGLRQLRLLGH